MKHIRIFIFFISILVIKVGYCQNGFSPEFMYRPTLDQYWSAFENGAIICNTKYFRQKLINNGIKQINEVRRNCDGDTISSIVTKRNLACDTISVVEIHYIEKYTERYDYYFSKELLIESSSRVENWSTYDSSCYSRNYCFIYKEKQKFPEVIIQIENGDTIRKDNYFFFNSGNIKKIIIDDRKKGKICYSFKSEKNTLSRFHNDSLDLQVTFDSKFRPVIVVNSRYDEDLNLEKDTTLFTYLSNGSIITDQKRPRDGFHDIQWYKKDNLYIRHIIHYSFDDNIILYGTYRYDYFENGLLKSKAGTDQYPYWCASSQDINVIYFEFYYSYF